MYIAKHWIDKLGLIPHPEGGYYREIYRSSGEIRKECLPETYVGSRNFATSIYFLLEKNQKSHFHRLKSDEIWYFHAGDSIDIHLLHPDQKYKMVTLGPNIDQNEELQIVIPAGTYFGALVKEHGNYGLVGCVVSPGFHFDDFEMPERDTLIKKYPHQKDIIFLLTLK